MAVHQRLVGLIDLAGPRNWIYQGFLPSGSKSRQHRGSIGCTLSAGTQVLRRFEQPTCGPGINDGGPVGRGRFVGGHFEHCGRFVLDVGVVVGGQVFAERAD